MRFGVYENMEQENRIFLRLVEEEDGNIDLVVANKDGSHDGSAHILSINKDGIIRRHMRPYSYPREALNEGGLVKIVGVDDNV